MLLLGAVARRRYLPGRSCKGRWEKDELRSWLATTPRQQERRVTRGRSFDYNVWSDCSGLLTKIHSDRLCLLQIGVLTAALPIDRQNIDAACASKICYKSTKMTPRETPKDLYT
jgi:hypothetical protein